MKVAIAVYITLTLVYVIPAGLMGVMLGGRASTVWVQVIGSWLLTTVVGAAAVAAIYGFYAMWAWAL